MVPLRIPILLFLLLLPGCLDVTQSTRVRENGSLESVVTVIGDSASIHSGAFTISLDSTWRKTIAGTSDGKFRMTASHSFGNDREMNDAMRVVPGRTLDLTVKLEKKFRWFFETYRYSETCRSFHQFNSIPLDRYISKAEMDILMKHLIDKSQADGGGDSLVIERTGKKLEAWEARNEFEALYAVLLEGVKRRHDPALTPAMVEAEKESLAAALMYQSSEVSSDAVVKKLAEVFDSTAVRKALEANAGEMQFFEQRRNFHASVIANSYEIRADMPGMITATNSTSVEGSSVSWKDITNRCYIADYTMWVESRVIHWWAIFVTAAVVIGALALVVIGTIRSRSMP